MGTTQQAAEAVARAAGLDSDADFAAMVMTAVGTVLPHDGYCLFGVDPGSRLRTFMLSRHGLDGVAARLTYNETVERDANRYADLAAASVPAGVLSTSGPRDVRSPRLHEILRPAGMQSELRLGLGTSSAWVGGVSLFRADRRRPFGRHDVRVATDIAGALAYAVRRRPLRPVPHRPTVLPPGVVLLDPKNNVVSMTAEALAWLEDLSAGGSDEVAVVDVMRVVFEAGNAVRSVGPGPRSVCRVRTSSGRWLAVQGTRANSGPADVAVILAPASLGQLLPVVGAWAGLTPRESQVLALAAQGLPSQRVASGLGLSLLTVHTHLRSIYRKSGVSSRDELVGRLT